MENKVKTYMYTAKKSLPVSGLFPCLFPYTEPRMITYLYYDVVFHYYKEKASLLLGSKDQ